MVTPPSEDLDARRHYRLNHALMWVVALLYPFFYVNAMWFVSEQRWPSAIGFLGPPVALCGWAILAKTTMGFRIGTAALLAFCVWVCWVSLGMSTVLLSIG